MKNLQKITFFIVLAVSLLLVILQLVEYYYPKDILITVIDASWSQNIKTLGLYALGLVVLNVIAYKSDYQTSPKNKYDRWMLASSVVILLCYGLTRLLLPYIFIAQLSSQGLL